MNASEVKINIIGAGISGLIAAHLLESYGFKPVIWEASDRVGGRMKTDLIDGYQLDRGFQVLLDQYPSLKKYLNFEELELQKLLPGALIIKDNKRYSFGDPLRSFSSFWSSAFSPVAKLSDLSKLFRLRNDLASKDLRDHFKGERTTSLEFLKSYGFSDQVIEHFFRPFFSGIFLENELKTSSEMLQFVYALFSKGNAVIPKAGIEAVPKQLAEKLKDTKLHFNTKIDRIEEGKLIINGVDQIASDFTIIACDPSKIVPQLANDSVLWNRLDTFYYEVDKDVFSKPIIGLETDDEFINHLFFPQSVSVVSRGEKELISVNVVKRKNESTDNLKRHIEDYLDQKLGLSEARLIKHYEIEKALPRFERMQYDSTAEESKLNDNVYIIGDQQINPSQNAAILSAEAVVSAIVDKEMNNQLKQ